MQLSSLEPPVKMDSLQEVSSTMAEDSEVFIEIEVSQPHNGISFAEAANALITLQIPSKESASLPITSSKNGDCSDDGKTTTEGNPKDVRKRILEGMKSQFNTTAEEEINLEQSNRRGPHRQKSKFKRQDNENEEDGNEVTVKVENPKQSRGRGRPPKVVPVEKNHQIAPEALKIETEIPRSEIDSSSEAGSERSDSATGTPSIMTTRRSQRTNISRTSASDLLKGLSETRPVKKASSNSEPELCKPVDLPRKRGRPSKSASSSEAKNLKITNPDDILVDDVSKVEHMASLGLQSKSSPDQSKHSNKSSLIFRFRHNIFFTFNRFTIKQQKGTNR